MGMANGVRPVGPMDFAGVRFGFRVRGPCCVVLTYDECLAVCENCDENFSMAN
jgi:hypothetical protein